MLDTISNIASAIGNFANSLGSVAKGLNDRNTYIRIVLVLLGFVMIAAVLLNAARG